MVKQCTLDSRLIEFPCLAKDPQHPNTLICSTCNKRLNNADTTTITRHIAGGDHKANVLEKIEKEDKVTRLRSKTLLESLPEKKVIKFHRNEENSLIPQIPRKWKNSTISMFFFDLGSMDCR